MPRRERYRDWKVFFPLAVLGLEPRVSCMLGKLCHWATPPLKLDDFKIHRTKKTDKNNSLEEDIYNSLIFF
jgi:hypothetical protein